MNQANIDKKERAVSCIIPAYNEASRISNVLDVVIRHPLIKEVIVINDGSTDSTSQVLNKFTDIKIVDHFSNLGKSRSVLDGIKMSSGDVILFLDADLVGLQMEDITKLIEPVLYNNADVTISLRKNAPLYARAIGLDYISGDRVIKKEWLGDFEELSKISGWGLESAYFNKKIINNNLRIKVVLWNSTTSPFPSKKFGFIKGNIRLLKMIAEIVRANGLLYSLYQVVKMLRLKTY